MTVKLPVKIKVSAFIKKESPGLANIFVEPVIDKDPDITVLPVIFNVLSK